MTGRKSFLVRLPEELLEELNRWARDDLRSVNGQIEYLLKQAVLKRKGRGQAEQGTRPTEEGMGAAGEGEGRGG